MDLEDDINKDMNEPEYKSGYEEAEKELAINLNQHYADNPNLPIIKDIIMTYFENQFNSINDGKLKD
jgi:hypothetical protein